MDKTEIITFLKKNAFALSCGVVAIGAAVTAYVPLGKMVTDLGEKASTEAGNYQKLKQFDHPRKFPLLDPTSTTPVELTGFPNSEQVKIGKDAVAKLATQSAASMEVLLSLNNEKIHPPLVQGALPAPLSDTPKFQFADVYKRALSMDPTESGLGSPSVPPPIQANRKTPAPMAIDERLAVARALNLANDVLRAGTPVDAKMLKERQDWLKINEYDPRLVLDNSGVAVNAAEVQAAMTADFAVLQQKMNEEIAARSHVYLDPNAFLANSTLLSAANPQLHDIWFAQLSFWVQSDIARAVAAANAGLNSVNDLPPSGVEMSPAVPAATGTPGEPALVGVPASPVKRILRLDMKPIPMYQFTTANGGPAAVDETGLLAPTYSVSPTGRTSNKMYDVVPFRLTVDVEADHVNRFLATLTRDRLIYIDNQDLYSIEPESLAPQGFIYGSKPVVRLILSGEELFLRKWTALLMPQRIKYLLGLEVPPAGSKITPLGGGAESPPPGMPDGGGMMPGGPGM